MRWQAERSRTGGRSKCFFLVGGGPLLLVPLDSQTQASYSQSAIHCHRATYGPTPVAQYQRRTSQQATLYGSMQSQSAFGSLPLGANPGADLGDYALSQQSTRSDTSERDRRSGIGFAPTSRGPSHINNYTGTAFAPTQPMAIAGRQPRRESFDSMYGFAMSPMNDDLGSREYEVRCRRCG